MAALTQADLTYIRAMSGDDCTPYEVSSEFIQYLHDEKAGGEPLCMSGDSLGSTVVWVLRARLRKAIKLFDEAGENTRFVSQKYTHLKEQLADAEESCGMGGGYISVGVFDLGYDRELSSTEYTSLYGWWAWSWGGHL